MLTKRGIACLIAIVIVVAFLTAVAFSTHRRVTYDGHAIYINGEFYLELEDESCE